MLVCGPERQDLVRVMVYHHSQHDKAVLCLVCLTDPLAALGRRQPCVVRDQARHACFVADGHMVPSPSMSMESILRCMAI